jgi:hypothetical protein
MFIFAFIIAGHWYITISVSDPASSNVADSPVSLTSALKKKAFCKTLVRDFGQREAEWQNPARRRLLWKMCHPNIPS